MYFLVWCTVWAAAEGQETRNIFFVKLIRCRRFHEGLQPGRPKDSSWSEVVIEGTHAREIVREDYSSVGSVADHDTPVADEVDEAAGAPAFIRGESKRLVTCVAPQEVFESQEQVIAIIEPAVPRENLAQTVLMAHIIQPSQTVSCVHDWLLFLITPCKAPEGASDTWASHSRYDR